MNNLSSFSERLQSAFQPTERGVIDVVDRLVDLSQHHGLQLVWGDGRCRIRPLGIGPEESTDVLLPKSVFRAILARVAALCNEKSSNSVSPYGGESGLVVAGRSPSAIQVIFVNTSAEQRLELRPVQVAVLETEGMATSQHGIAQ